MGLRSLVHPVLELPPADPPGAQEGLSVENLSCAFDKQPVFGSLGFSAKRGEVLGIVGHNGAGKTTMTRLPVRAFERSEWNGPAGRANTESKTA